MTCFMTIFANCSGMKPHPKYFSDILVFANGFDEMT